MKVTELLKDYYINNDPVGRLNQPGRVVQGKADPVIVKAVRICFVMIRNNSIFTTPWTSRTV
jgi:hypothetical protein